MVPRKGRVFGVGKRSHEGLALARQCQHEEARFLVSLFLTSAPATRESAEAYFLTRCLCWAVECGAQPRRELLQRAAESGYGYAQVRLAAFVENRNERLKLIHKAAACGEPEALFLLGCELETVEVRALWQEAARLGQRDAQLRVALILCPSRSLEQLQWARRASCQGLEDAKNMLSALSPTILEMYENGWTSGLSVFELGTAMANDEEWKFWFD